MNSAIRIFCLLPCLLLLSCGGGGKSAAEARKREEARIQREVDQRVTEIRSEMKVSEKRWNTARTVAFCALAGGALLWLLGDKRGGNLSATSDSLPRIPQQRTRMFDRDHPYEDEDDEHHPYRR